MINSYVRFDSVKFLKESREWKKRRDLLEAELDSIPLVTAIHHRAGQDGKSPKSS